MSDLTPEAVNQALKVDLEIVLQYEGDTREIEAFHVLKEAARKYANPDYEAAQKLLDSIIDGLIPKGQGMAIDATFVVDAALGVTKEE